MDSFSFFYCTKNTLCTYCVVKEHLSYVVQRSHFYSLCYENATFADFATKNTIFKVILFLEKNGFVGSILLDISHQILRQDTVEN